MIGQLHLAFMQMQGETMQDPFIRSDQQRPHHTFNFLPSITCQLFVFPSQPIDPSISSFFCPDKQQGDWTGRREAGGIRDPSSAASVLPFM
jgi:hypothetical protein